MESELKEIIRQTYRESLRESVNEDATELPQATIPSAVKVKLQMAIDKIKDSKLSNNAKLQLVAQVIDALDVDKSQLSNIANKIRSKMESVVSEAKYPTNLYVNSVIYGQGFTGLKGIEGGKYYKVVEMDDYSATLAPCDEKGKIKGSKKVRHKLSSLEGGIATAKRGDENGIVIESIVNETVSHEAMGIASMTNTRKEAVQKFIDDNNLNAKEILNHVTKGKLPERIRFVQALVGTPNNSSFKWYVKNYANESVTEGKKAFKINPPIGKAKYSISAHNGVSKHKDGSDFWDILIFKNKADLERRAKYFRGEKYIEESVISEDIKSDINKFLDKLNKQFPEQEYTTDFKGGKYAKIVQQSRKYSGNRSAWGFVSMEDNPSKGFKKGDLLKAAGFNTPAKGARGNILDGTAKYDKWSPVYLR
jgi:hypothetical protein